MNSHTPGPWTIGIPLDAAYAHTLASGRLIFGDESNGGACVAVTNPHFGRGEADAHLIAAAPELLDALKGILRITDRNHVAWHAARASIAKAEGRPEEAKVLADEVAKRCGCHADLLRAAKGILEDYENDHGSGVCDCRLEPNNAGHVCNACLARAAIAKAEGREA